MATTYTFKAMDLAGVPAQGVVEAESKQDVANQLKERGLVVIDIAAKYRSKELNVELFARVKAKDLAVASRQLATMVTSGMPILRALYVLEQQTESKILAGTLAEVRKDVEAGLLLSDSLARHPKVFGPLYVSMVARRGDRRRARGMPPARRRPAREGRRAAPPGALGDGLPRAR